MCMNTRTHVYLIRLNLIEYFFLSEFTFLLYKNIINFLVSRFAMAWSNQGSSNALISMDPLTITISQR